MDDSNGNGQQHVGDTCENCGKVIRPVGRACLECGYLPPYLRNSAGLPNAQELMDNAAHYERKNAKLTGNVTKLAVFTPGEIDDCPVCDFLRSEGVGTRCVHCDYEPGKGPDRIAMPCGPERRR